jgi:integrase
MEIAMEQYYIKKVLFSNGERFSYLINKQTNLPDYWCTLYTLTQLRSTNKASGTIEQYTRSILFLKSILDKYEISENEFISRLRDGWILHLYEIDNIAEECKFKYEDIKTNKVDVVSQKIAIKSLEKFRKITSTKSLNRVDSHTQANRLRNIRDFILWLVDIQASKFNHKDKKLQLLMDAKIYFSNKIDSRIPKISNDNIEPKEGLSQEELLELFSTIKFDSINNPWKSEFVKKRNELLILWFYHFGIRRGEVLTVKISEINFQEETFTLFRCSDDANDPRKDQPNLKTNGRKLSIPKKIINLTSDYIIKYRSKLPNSKDHEYLFVADITGSPLSKITVNKIFEQLRNKNKKLPKNFSPHILRHSWNDSFSKLIDKENISESEEQKMRNYLMGWSDTSTMASTYTKRHTREKANEAIVNMSEKLFSDKEIK